MFGNSSQNSIHEQEDFRHCKRNQVTVSQNRLKPMLATLVDKPFDAPGWTYEIKWDGYRAIAFLNERNCEPDFQEQ
jgi:ATP-dependent DNA ligase